MREAAAAEARRGSGRYAGTSGGDDYSNAGSLRPRSAGGAGRGGEMRLKTVDRRGFAQMWASAEDARLDRTMLVQAIHRDDEAKLTLLTQRLLAARTQPPAPAAPPGGGGGLAGRFTSAATKILAANTVVNTWTREKPTAGPGWRAPSAPRLARAV
jgi:hypothetical protein